MKRYRLVLPTLALGLSGLLAACESDADSASPTEPTPPAAPTGVSAAAVSPTSVRVTFGSVAGATQYTIQRAPGSGGEFANVGTATASPFEATGLSPATAYRFRVSATVGAQTSAWSDAAAVTTPAAGPKVATISSDITTSRTLFADTVYTLRGFIKVANGATLTIQPGTLIQGDYETLGSSLFVLRGAKIEANGTADKPIVFTSSRPAGQRQPGDWGGLIIVGNGITNRGGTIVLEGTGTGASNPQVVYSGGNNNADNSGTLRYVRVEFAGYATAPDAELNSFTFAAVGSGTTMSHLQVLSGLDDSFEWFGGAVDAKYLLSYEAGDDHFDMSEGYSGRLQYLIALQSRQILPRTGAGNVSSDPQGIENDGCAGSGCTNGQDSEPLTLPLVANFTLVGAPTGVFSGSSGGVGMVLRRGTGGWYVNGAVARWERAAISLRDGTTQARANAGQLVVRNILAAQVPGAFEGGSGRFTVDATANSIETSSATAVSLFTSLPISPTAASQFDWTPSANSALRSGGTGAFSGALATKAGIFVDGTSFRGAADPNGPKWWAGWTNYADN